MKNKTAPEKYARYALTLLLSVNMLNYVDRQVLYAVFPLIKSDFNLSDTELGLLGSAFMVCYMVSAPLCGWLGDRLSRVRVASCGLMLWSVATGLSGFASSYRLLLAARTAVGVGEASFSTVSPGILSDYFPADIRGRILSCFYLAIPVGSIDAASCCPAAAGFCSASGLPAPNATVAMYRHTTTATTVLFM